MLYGNGMQQQGAAAPSSDNSMEREPTLLQVQNLRHPYRSTQRSTQSCVTLAAI